MIDSLYIAVDLGAGSGRVFLAGVAADEFLLEEISRFQYPPTEENGHLRWNFERIFAEIKNGLQRAGERARELNRKIYSIGVDSWAVDYGLIDKSGSLIADPVCYRDPRTNGAMERVFEKIPRREIFERTGIQFLCFNTLFQLSSENGAMQKADKILLLPDLINYFLTGKAVGEYTNATTTQMVGAHSKNWDAGLIEKINLPPGLLPEIIAAGTDLGLLKPELAEELNLRVVRVVAPATHDTASAVAGAPLEKSWAYISSGTWSLVGVERDKVLINEAVASHNFTNEGGAFDTIRFLKNVSGLWIFESCRQEWKERGISIEYERIFNLIETIKHFQGFIFPDDERFLNPPSMLKAVSAQLEETGQKILEEPIIIFKIVLDSLALRYASVLRTIENLTAEKIAGVQIVGGGGRNNYLNQMTANASGLTVKAGLIEATVTGNVLVQAIAAGRFEGLKDARNYVAENVNLKEFTPRNSPQVEDAKRQYAAIESRFLGDQ